LHPSVPPTSSSQAVLSQLKVSSPTVFHRPASYQSSPQSAVSSSAVSQINIEEILPPPKAFARRGEKIFKLANYGGMTSNEMIEQMRQAKVDAEAAEESKQLKKQQREEKKKLTEELDQQKALKRKIKQEPVDDPEEKKKRIPVKRTAKIVSKQSLDDPTAKNKRKCAN
jgi:flagellar biosynthesis GTPase FlhF